MLSTGITKVIKKDSKIGIPREFRIAYEITSKDSFELFTKGDTIILKKFESGCTFCGQFFALEPFKGTQICRECIESVKEELLVVGGESRKGSEG